MSLFRIINTLTLFSLLSVACHGDVQFKREHIKSISVVAPVWKDYTNQDGSGLYWDIIRNVYEPLGIKVKISQAPWKRAMKMVSKYRTYSAIVGETLDSKESVIFPTYPINVKHMAVLTKKQVDFEWLGVNSLKGKNVAWNKGLNLIHNSDQGFKLNEVRSVSKGVRLLVQNEVDFVIGDPNDINEALEKQQLSSDDYATYQMQNGRDVYLAFSVDDLSRELIDIYNERIEDLSVSGELEKIYKKWPSGEIPQMLVGLADDLEEY